MNRERYSMASVEMATPIPWWGEPMLIGCVIGGVNWCLALFFGPETKGKEMVRWSPTSCSPEAALRSARRGEADSPD